MALQIRYAAKSDVGLVRPGNEDSGYAGPRVLMVADGMGGHAAGELASATAVAIIAGLDGGTATNDSILAELSVAVEDTGDAIGATIAADPEFTGMGTTVTGAYWLGDRFAIVHVGDSRAYLLRDGELLQLTHDHTYVQTLVDAGRITPEEALFHPRRSLLMRALDGMNPVEPDLSIREARAGDRLLLCTDGLCGLLPNDVIAAALTGGEPTGAVMRLVDLALEHGAPDNVTVVVADVIEGDPSAESALSDLPPVVVGAAGEPRVRFALPHVTFPDDAQPDPDAPDAPPPVDSGPPTAEQPLIDSAIVVPAAETARRAALVDAQVAAEHKRTRRRRTWIIAVIAVLGAVILAGVVIAKSWVNNQWYVAINGAAGTGTVAVYHGVPGTLLGFEMSSLDYDSQLVVGELPLFDQELVSKGIPAASQGDAMRIVTELHSRANACKAVFPPAGCPGQTS